jgi:hypothetical protein
MIRYYVYFDAYGHPSHALSAAELDARFAGDPEAYHRSICPVPRDAGPRFSTGHVGVLTFQDEAEMRRFLDSLGDEIVGFYEGAGENRPYNF